MNDLRQQAKERGDTTYTARKPCKHNHAPVRLTSNGVCVQCSHEIQKKHRTIHQPTYALKYANTRHLHVTRVRNWRVENPDKYQALRKRRSHIKQLLGGARARAKKRSLEFTLKPEDVVIPTVCPVLGIQIIPNLGKFNPNSPSLDRLDSSKGYTPENVRVISWRANSVKNDATIDELKAVVSYLERELK